MMRRQTLTRPTRPRPPAASIVLPHEPGFSDEVALMRVLADGERSWEDIVASAPLTEAALDAAVDALVDGRMLAVRALEDERAAFSLTARGRARLAEVDAAFRERRS